MASQWFYQYGWAILCGATVALGSLWNLNRRARRTSARRHRGLEIVGVVLGAAMTLLALLAWAMGWK
jgi:hypothetical protein